MSKIFLLRGEKVLLDLDLAEMYGVETGVLNQAVRRNARGFPKDFMFTLTREAVTRLSQSVTSSQVKYSKRVTAFTEQGVAMLLPEELQPARCLLVYALCPMAYALCSSPRTTDNGPTL